MWNKPYKIRGILYILAAILCFNLKVKLTNINIECYPTDSGSAQPNYVKPSVYQIIY